MKDENKEVKIHAYNYVLHIKPCSGESQNDFKLFKTKTK